MSRIPLWNRWPVTLTAAACIGLALALGRPTAAVERPVFRLAVLLDISQSMNTRDCRRGRELASRLDCAKAALRDGLRELPCGSELALGIFTGYRAFFLTAPVETCANARELSAILDHLDWRAGWEGGSEIAKGLASGLRLVRGFEPVPALLFFTDGHEAPPVDPRRRPPFPGKAGEVAGLVIGVGGPTPAPIPKFDMDGRFLGYWRADEVVQDNPYPTRKGSSVPGEPMEGAAASGASAGSEHLSSLREPYLRELAGSTGLGYRRLGDAGLVEALRIARLARPVPARADLRWACGLAALAALLASYFRRKVG